MRDKPLPFIEYGRILGGKWESPLGAQYGAFTIRNPRNNHILHVISSGALNEWEHVSVSRKTCCPTWDDMCFVKKAFWLPTETVVQYHPPESDYVNNHENCLHLWRNTKHEFQLPPKEYV
jgi:hypothetical protein